MNITVPARPRPVRPTTWIEPDDLRTALGLRVTLVSETFQRTGAFKFRAAYNRARNTKATHIVAASSGNFGQGLAFACQLLGKRATIVMPKQGMRMKMDAVRGYGGEVVLADTDKESRADVVERFVREHPGAEPTSGYDDVSVIAGNATLGVEIGARLKRLSEERLRRAVVVVPVGGGGISAGIVTGLRAVGLPEVPVVGAEPLLANDAAQSLRAGRLVTIAGEAPTLADGARLPCLGNTNWEILRTGLRDIVEVPEEAIAEGLRALFSGANLKVEPTGALGVGALLTAPERFEENEVFVVITGGNVDPAMYSRILAGANSVAEAYGDN